MILKASPDVDLYCEWSGVVDGPTLIGTRAEFLEELQRHADLNGHDYHVSCPAISRKDAEEMLARADQTGTSVRHRFGPHKPGAWDAPTLTYQRGTIQRKDLMTLLEALQGHEPWWTDGETPPAALALITPFEE